MVTGTISNRAQTHHTPAKRGRKATPPNPDDGPVAAFARELWALKRHAGDPSFATMCTRLGAAASKSTLAAATRGTALPSWETTWEFVRVLAVDQLDGDHDEVRRDWLARWRAAGNAAGQPVSAAPAPADPAPAAPADPAPADPAPGDGGPVRPTPAFRPIRGMVLGACVLAVVAVGLGSLVTASPAPVPEQTATARSDDAIFEGDVTIPDGSRVAPGQEFTKVWQLRNTGSMRWEGRYLTRVNSTACQAPSMAPIPTTEPGDSVRIEVPVTASDSPARCKIYWKMTDASRRLLLPHKNPIFLDVVVRNRV